MPDIRKQRQEETLLHTKQTRVSFHLPRGDILHNLKSVENTNNKSETLPTPPVDLINGGNSECGGFFPSPCSHACLPLLVQLVIRPLVEAPIRLRRPDRLPSL